MSSTFAQILPLIERIVGLFFSVFLSLALPIFQRFSSFLQSFLDRSGLRGPLWNVFVHILTHYRSLLVITFVLPLSFLFDLFWSLRTRYVNKFHYGPRQHSARLEEILQRVQQWNREGKKTKMCTARPGWMTVSPRHAQYKNVLFTVDTHLPNILHLDREKMVLTTEPSVNIIQLLDYLLPKGLTLPVVPEMDELTVGGLVNGYGIEVTSHKYGLFNEICVAFEIVLPNGTIRRVTKDDKLFHAIPWSFGTVGFLTAVELKLIPAAKYVRHRYIPVNSRQECVKVWTELQTAENPPEFLEGIMYSEHKGVILAGEFANGPSKGEKVNYINRWFKPYFYMHCKSFSDANQEGVELIPLKDYYRRHVRGIFWALKDQIPICNHWLFRWTLGWSLPPRVAFLKLIESEAMTQFYEENYVMQDLLLPLEKMDEIISLCEKELAVYPLWLCPFKVSNTGKYQGKIRAPKGTKKEGDYAHFVDAATIGEPGVKHFNTEKSIQKMEAYLRKVGGFQGNYSYTYQTLQEFRQMFDHTLYDQVRAETNGDEAFPESFDKVTRKNQWSKKNQSNGSQQKKN